MPRTLHLSEYGAGGAQPSGPANSGWPDSGVELAISLVLPATADPAAAAAGGGVEARVGSDECVARVAAGAGALLLLLLLLLLPFLPPPSRFKPYRVHDTQAATNPMSMYCRRAAADARPASAMRRAATLDAGCSGPTAGATSATATSDRAHPLRLQRTPPVSRWITVARGRSWAALKANCQVMRTGLGAVKLDRLKP